MLSLYGYARNCHLLITIAAHVDDYLYCYKNEVKHVIDKIFGNFEVKEIHTGKFRFCGREYEKLPDFSIRVTCKDSASS